MRMLTSPHLTQRTTPTRESHIRTEPIERSKQINLLNDKNRETGWYRGREVL